MKGENGSPETPDWILPPREDDTFTTSGMKLPALWEGDQA